MNGPFENASMNDYFATLSPLVQQSILHNSIEVNSLSDLQNLAAKMSDSHSQAKG